MIEIFLPRTDAGALAQAAGAFVLFASVAIVVRRNRDALMFVAGLATITVAWFGLRTVH